MSLTQSLLNSVLTGALGSVRLIPVTVPEPTRCSFLYYRNSYYIQISTTTGRSGDVNFWDGYLLRPSFFSSESSVLFSESRKYYNQYEDICRTNYGLRGELKEPVDSELIDQMYISLMRYRYPKRRNPRWLIPSFYQLFFSLPK